MTAVIFALIFLWAFYWPLLFVRLGGIFAKASMTWANFLVSVLIAAAAAFLGNVGIYSAVPPFLLTTMLVSSLIPIILLIALRKASRMRTKTKVIVLAAYFHIFWQLLPGISLYPIFIDVLITLALLAMAKSKFRGRRKTKLEHVHGSISKLWE